MNDNNKFDDEQPEEQEYTIFEFDPLTSLMFLLTDLLYDAVKAIICMGIWNLILIQWFSFLPIIRYIQMFVIIVFINILTSGRLND